MAIFWRGPSNGSLKCMWSGQKSRFSTISGFGSVINSFDHGVKCITADANDDRHESVNLVYDSKARRRFCCMRDAMHKRGLCSRAVCVCPSVCPSCLSRSCFLSKWINLNIFYFYHLVFPHQTLRQYSDGDPLTRASNACGVNKNRDSGLIYGLIACRERCDRQVTWHIQLRRTVASWWHSSLVSGRRFLFAKDDDEVFVTRSHNVTPKTAEQNLTVCSGKSEAAITNISTRPRPPLDHVAVTSRQWIQSQSTETTRAGLRDLRRGRALSVSVHYRRR